MITIGPGISLGHEVTIGAPTVESITGGTISTANIGGVNYKIHKFTSNGILKTNSTKTVEYFVVAGGGGGGSNTGGGGGGGEVKQGTITLLPTSYTVVVGAGGNAGDPIENQGSNGGNSYITGASVSINTIGGGLGGTGGNGYDGGSGGGAASGHLGGASLAGQYPGGDGTNGSAGGGGAGQAGKAAITNGYGGNGGDGISSTFDGFVRSYAAGGGGAAYSNIAGSQGLGGSSSLGGDGGRGYLGVTYLTATSGTPNTGSGGGGGYNDTEAPGGSGIVMIRYQI